MKTNLRALAIEYMSTNFVALSAAYDLHLLPEQCPPGSQSERAMIRLVNQLRSAAGMYPLGEQVAETVMARFRAQRQQPAAEDFHPTALTAAGRDEIKRLVQKGLDHGWIHPPGATLDVWDRVLDEI